MTACQQARQHVFDDFFFALQRGIQSLTQPQNAIVKPSLSVTGIIIQWRHLYMLNGVLHTLLNRLRILLIAVACKTARHERVTSATHCAVSSWP